MGALSTPSRYYIRNWGDLAGVHGEEAINKRGGMGTYTVCSAATNTSDLYQGQPVEYQISISIHMRCQVSDT